MDTLKSIVIQAQNQDLDAYNTLVHRFQNMAVGYAYSILGDFHLAEDAAQEAFVRAYLELDQLREPAAFAGWFRRIVFMRCNRFTRKKKWPTVSLDHTLVSPELDPHAQLEEQETKNRVQQAIQNLPESEREVTTLYYIDEHSQKEIGAFLNLPTQTVKSRLHTARKRLQKRMITMVKKNLQDERPSNDPDFQVKVIQELEETTQLTDREIQIMLREVNTKDLALAMVNASDAFKKRIYANVSARVGKIIDDYIDSQMPVSDDRAAQNQNTVVEIVQALIAKGAIVWPPEKEKAPSKPLSKDYLEMKKNLEKQLQDIPISHLDFEALTQTLVDLANVARTEGILALEHIEQEATDPDGFFSLCYQLIIDGVAPHLVKEITAARKKVLLHQYESKLDMMMTGIQATQLGENPRIIEQKLRAMF